MGNGGQDESGRLDSWKAIAVYLNRDESTVRRWERQLGLPIRRMPGGRGASVYAFTSEIDAWLKASPPQMLENGQSDSNGANGHDRQNGDNGQTPDALPAPLPAPARQRWRLALIAIASVSIIVAGAWRLRSAAIRVEDLGITLTAEAITATNRDGAQVWRYPLPSEYRIGFSEYGRRLEVLGGSNPEILVALGIRTQHEVGRTESGQLMAFSPGGDLRRTFAFEDRATFDQKAFGPPWVMAALAVDDRPGSRRIAVAGHHFQFSPSMVTLLDETFQRRATYWQWGWIEAVHWVAANRLLIGGYNSPRGGMVALLDPSALEGRAPEAPGDPAYCQSCGKDALPLRMMVMPATELNRASLARFNRAAIQVLPDRIVARTIEIEQNADHAAIDVLYEFTPRLDLIRASYGGGYWDMHERLEREGKLHHSRAECPDRDGPREILVWEPASGWRREPIAVR